MNAFLIVVVVDVNVVCKCVQEDFHTLTYGFKMSGDETDAAVMSPVKELEEELGRIIKVSGALCGIVRFVSFLHRTASRRQCPWSILWNSFCYLRQGGYVFPMFVCLFATLR